MRASIYARVSTKRQETENQIIELKEFVERKGWELSGEYIDKGIKGYDTRPQLEAMLQDAHEGKFDVAVFWSFDRVSRKGLRDLFRILDQLKAAEVDFVSLKERWLQSLGPWRDAVLGFISEIAKWDHQRYSERITAGLKRARKYGTKTGNPIGRPKLNFDPEYIKHLRDELELSWTEMASVLECSRMTARRHYQKAITKPLPQNQANLTKGESS